MAAILGLVFVVSILAVLYTKMLGDNVWALPVWAQGLLALAHLAALISGIGLMLVWDAAR